MNYQVVVSATAERQLLESAVWWADNRSVEQVLRWHDAFSAALLGLANDLHRKPLAREDPYFSFTLHELRLGLFK